MYTLTQDVALRFEPDALDVSAHVVAHNATEPNLRAPGFAAPTTPWWESWWQEECLDPLACAHANDRPWQWNLPVEYAGRQLAADCINIVTDDHAVQGAMIISRDVIRSELLPHQRCLFVDQLASAPRNQKKLRRDRQPWYRHAGTRLIQYAALLSLAAGCDGKILLHAAPACLDWYQHLGFVQLGLPPVTYDQVHHFPMELPTHAVTALLTLRGGIGGRRAQANDVPSPTLRALDLRTPIPSAA